MHTKTTVDTKRRGVGRPRSEATRRLILATVLHLLEKETVQSITVEAIASAAGVSKTTIYRWWSSKSAVVIDAFIEHHIVQTPISRDVPPGDALAEHLRLLIKQYSGLPGRIVAQIIAEAQFNPDIASDFRVRFYYGRRAVVREAFEAWRRSGEIDPSINIELLMDILYAPVYMRLLLGHAPLDEKFAHDLPVFVYSLLGVKPPRPVPALSAPQKGKASAVKGKARPSKSKALALSGAKE